MKIEKFKLRSILSFRKFLKMQAASRLAEAALRRLEAQEAVDRLSDMLSDLEHQFTLTSKVSARASELLILQRALSQQRERIQAAREVYEEAQQIECSSREKLVETQQAYESILKLEEKHHEQIRAQVLRNEEMAMNEFTMSRGKDRSRA